MHYHPTFTYSKINYETTILCLIHHRHTASVFMLQNQEAIVGLSIAICGFVTFILLSWLVEKEREGEGCMHIEREMDQYLVKTINVMCSC